MSREVSVSAVEVRLERLRAIYLAEDVNDARRRLDADAKCERPFTSAVASRLEELRALCELTAHLQRRR